MFWSEEKIAEFQQRLKKSLIGARVAIPQHNEVGVVYSAFIQPPILLNKDGSSETKIFNGPISVDGERYIDPRNGIKYIPPKVMLCINIGKLPGEKVGHAQIMGSDSVCPIRGWPEIEAWKSRSPAPIGITQEMSVW